MKPTLQAPGSERLKLTCDDLLSIFAFNFNLRHYIKVPKIDASMYPDSFGVDRKTIRCKKGDRAQLQVSYLPFTMVGPGGYCPPRHLPQCDTGFLSQRHEV
jgi:hypothetical protein